MASRHIECNKQRFDVDASAACDWRNCNDDARAHGAQHWHPCEWTEQLGARGSVADAAASAVDGIADVCSELKQQQQCVALDWICLCCRRAIAALDDANDKRHIRARATDAS